MRKPNHDDIFALDLGTTKFCLAALRKDPHTNQTTLDMVSVPAGGMHRGMLSQFEKAKDALTTLIQVAEKQFDCDIEKVTVGIAGSHLSSRIVKATFPITTPSVTHQTLRQVVEKVEADHALADRELLHTVPVAFQVDRRPEGVDPIGLSGKQLRSTFFLVDADRAYLKDVIRLCNACGLEVGRLLSEPFASASVTVPDQYKELGVALADIGGGTTDGIVFIAGRPRAIFTVNIAGRLMTNDLAVGLNIPREEAEKLKVFFGLARRDDNEVYEAKTINDTTKNISWRDIYPILGARVAELGALMARDLAPFKPALGAGLLLTGGGSEVLAMDDFFGKRMTFPVRRCLPALSKSIVLENQDMTDTSSPLSTQPAAAPNVLRPYATKYATVLGLINLEIGLRKEAELQANLAWPMRYISHFVNWIRELS